MRKSLLLLTTSLVVFGVAGPSMASDLGLRLNTKAPPAMMGGTYDWSGFYVGLNGGGGATGNCWDFLSDSVPSHTDNRYGAAMPDGCHNGTGGTFGGQLGYRWQAANWVFGVEGQGNWANISGSTHSLHNFAYVKNSSIDSFGLITGQVGYAMNNVLLYVKGGAAVVDDKVGFNGADDKTGQPDRASTSQTRWGGTVGAGLEVGLGGNWSVGAEYNHIFLSQRDVPIVSELRGTNVRVREDVDVGLVRLNYNFGGARTNYAKAPAMPVVYDWSGLYLGLNGGGGASHNCWDLRDDQTANGYGKYSGREGCHNATGATFGGQIGYRWQMANWVFGIEGQGNWADLSGNNYSEVLNSDTFGVGAPFPANIEHFNRSRINGFGLITGQVGYTYDNALFYVKGGAAVVGTTFDEFLVNHNKTINTGNLSASATNTRWGGSLGAGLELGLTPNWSIGAEYNRIFLGISNVSLLSGGNLYKTDNIRQDINVGLVRLNYRLGGPITARY